MWDEHKTTVNKKQIRSWCSVLLLTFTASPVSERVRWVEGDTSDQRRWDGDQSVSGPVVSCIPLSLTLSWDWDSGQLSSGSPVVSSSSSPDNRHDLVTSNWHWTHQRKLDFQGRFLVCHYHSLQYQTSVGTQLNNLLPAPHLTISPLHSI